MGILGDLLTGRSKKQGEAARDIARSQGGAAKRVRTRAVAAASSGEEIDNLNSFIRNSEQSLGQQRRQLGRQVEILEASNPELIKLIQGEASRTLAPVRAERDQQRQSLVNRLREQLGSGAETSTAGMQALNQFDMQTSSVLAQQQQSSIGQLFGISQGFEGLAGANIGLGSNISGNFGQIAGLFGNRASRISNAEIGTGSQIVGLSGADALGRLTEQQGQERSMNATREMAGTVIGAASDERVKKGIKSAEKPIKEMFDSLSPKSYRYKDSFAGDAQGGNDRYVSVMAQDLEKTKLGRSFVTHRDDGTRIVDYGKGLGVMLAGQAHLHKKMNKIERTLGELIKK
jgi:hypothetical protein